MPRKPTTWTNGRHTVTLKRHPEDTTRPATLWTATCDCLKWSYQWGERREVRSRALAHLDQT